MRKCQPNRIGSLLIISLLFSRATAADPPVPACYPIQELRAAPQAPLSESLQMWSPPSLNYEPDTEWVMGRWVWDDERGYVWMYGYWCCPVYRVDWNNPQPVGGCSDFESVNFSFGISGSWYGPAPVGRPLFRDDPFGRTNFGVAGWTPVPFDRIPNAPSAQTSAFAMHPKQSAGASKLVHAEPTIRETFAKVNSAALASGKSTTEAATKAAVASGKTLAVVATKTATASGKTLLVVAGKSAIVAAHIAIHLLARK